MSDSSSPTKSFKDFIGWAFAGLVSVVLALVVTIYSSLHADVVRLDMETQRHALKIQSNTDNELFIRSDLGDIKKALEDLNRKLDLLKR